MSSETDTSLRLSFCAYRAFSTFLPSTPATRRARILRRCRAHFRACLARSGHLYQHLCGWQPGGLLTLTNCITAYQTEVAIYRLALRPPQPVRWRSCLCERRVCCSYSRPGVFTSWIFIACLCLNYGIGRFHWPFNFVTSGNQFMFGAAVIAHASYYVLLAAEEKTVYAQFVALAVAVSASSVGKLTRSYASSSALRRFRQCWR